MPRKKAAPASNSATLRLAQTCLQDALQLQHTSPPRALEQLSRAIRAVQDAGLHNSRGAAERDEARATLCIALCQRAAVVCNSEGVGSREQMLLDAQAAVDVASSTDNVVQALQVFITVHTVARRPEGLLAACNRLQEAMQRPREHPRLRFMHPLEWDFNSAAAAIAQARILIGLTHIEQRVDEAHSLREAGEPEKAVAAYSDALQAVQTALDGVQAAHESLRSKFQAEAAVLQLKALSGRAACLCKLGSHAAAIADYKLAVLTCPSLPAAHLNLGDALQIAGQHRAACLAYLRGAKTTEAHFQDFMQALNAVAALAGPQAFSAQQVSESLYLVACPVCGKCSRDLRKCGKCRIVRYCSPEHQKQDWRHHRRQCEALAAATADGREPMDDAADKAPCEALIDALRTGHGRILPRLQDAATWDALLEHVPLLKTQTGRAALMTQSFASFLLTLANAVVAFELDSRRLIRVHLINVEPHDRSYFEASSSVAKVLPFPQMELIFCGMGAVGGPISSKPGGFALLSATMSGRNAVSVGARWGVWHELEGVLLPPDLVMGFNTGLHDVAYEWLATLRALVARNVPCVFTAASEGEYERALAAVRAARASLAFHGPAVFPSPLSNAGSGELRYSNSYWVAFRGGGG